MAEVAGAGTFTGKEESNFFIIENSMESNEQTQLQANGDRLMNGEQADNSWGLGGGC